MNTEERNGKAQSLKGRLKQAAGVLADDPELEREGADERDLGEARQDLGKVRRKLGEAIEEFGKTIKR